MDVDNSGSITLKEFCQFARGASQSVQERGIAHSIAPMAEPVAEPVAEEEPVAAEATAPKVEEA